MKKNQSKKVVYYRILLSKNFEIVKFRNKNMLLILRVRDVVGAGERRVCMRIKSKRKVPCGVGSILYC